MPAVCKLCSAVGCHADLVASNYCSCHVTVRERRESDPVASVAGDHVAFCFVANAVAVGSNAIIDAAKEKRNATAIGCTTLAGCIGTNVVTDNDHSAGLNINRNSRPVADCQAANF